MQPSSLIFLVIIGIWAAYFIQYWVRRREHLATIRSVDAFSETMRVLERRAPLPSVDHGAQAPRTYAVSPARAMRPQVTVKRAAAHIAAPVVQRVAVSTPAETSAPIAASHTGMHPGRATRGVVVLIGLVGTLVFGALAAFGVLVSWSFVVPLSMAGIGLAWLRAGVQGEIKAQRAARGRARRAAARTAAPASSDTRVAASAAPAPERSAEVVAAEASFEPVVASAPFDVAADAVASAPARQEPMVQQPAAQEPVVAEHEVVLPELDEDDIPLTWDPRPVPRPTYTMKARAAERHSPAAEVEPAAQADQAAYDEIPERRISGL